MSGENRPRPVTPGVNTSGYVYGADGTRLMKLEQIGTQPQSTTLYVGGVEIREPGVNEVVLAYPHENVRLKFANANSTPEVSYLFRDHLNPVRMIADETQAIEERSNYKPFGEENESVLAASKAQETIGWIGERHDAGAGLQYLNARYYDPELGLFIQPDWFEVTKRWVGTNRYSYSFNDPVNLSDPSGNCPSCIGGILGAIAGVALQGVEDAWNRELSSKEEYGKAAITGAVIGATGGLAGGLASKGVAVVGKAARSQGSKVGEQVVAGAIGGAAAGATGSVIAQTGTEDSLIGLENHGQIDVDQVAKDAAKGALGGMGTGAIGAGAIVTGTTSLGKEVAKTPGATGKVLSDIVEGIVDEATSTAVGKAIDAADEETNTNGGSDVQGVSDEFD